MSRSKIIIIFLSIVAAICQQSFLPQFGFASPLNLILTLAILLLFLDSQFLFYWLIPSALILDIYSILPFPVITLSMLLSFFILKILFKNLFTNRSFYSLTLLTLIGTICYNFFIDIFVYLSYFLKIQDFYPIISKLYFINLFKQFLANTLFLIIVFSIINFLKLRLKRTFFFET